MGVVIPDPTASAAGPETDIVCVVCTWPIHRRDHNDAWCWTDPGAMTVAAHGDCLRRLGEHDLRIRR